MRRSLRSRGDGRSLVTLLVVTVGKQPQGAIGGAAAADFDRKPQRHRQRHEHQRGDESAAGVQLRLQRLNIRLLTHAVDVPQPCDMPGPLTLGVRPLAGEVFLPLRVIRDYRGLNAERELEFGVYAEVVEAGEARVGDPVEPIG